MKIAFAIEHFDSHQGGAEQYAWGLARHLLGLGHELHIFSRTAPVSPPGNIHLHRLNLPRLSFQSKQMKLGKLLSRELAKENFDVIHGFNHVWPCDLLRPGGGVHLAFETYNARSHRGNITGRIHILSNAILPRYKALRQNEKIQFSNESCRFMAVSNRVANDIKRYYPSCKDRIQVIPNGLDLKKFNPEAARINRTKKRQEFGCKEDTVLFLFASNNYRLKGLYDVIDALPLLRNRTGRPFSILIAGRDHISPFECHARRNDVMDLIKFIGPQDDMLTLYGAADILLHPTYYDACANVCLEALACGLPVLTTTNNGASELLSGEGCIIMDMPCSTEHMAEKLLQAIETAHKPEISAQQEALAQNYPIENNYSAVLTLYEHITKQKNRTPEGQH